MFETVFKDLYPKPNVVNDSRDFMESFIAKGVKDLRLDVNFIDDTGSFSKYSAFPGVHFLTLTSKC